MQLLAVDRPNHSLAWNTRLDDDADFLPLDPLALDYLGQHVGLWLFPALTTRTDRAQYFSIVRYGLALIALSRGSTFPRVSGWWSGSLVT